MRYHLENRKKAFTLIELLVVIGIIAILLSVVMPALAKAKLQALAIVCKSNIHQLVLSNICYAVENDGHYVPAAADIWDNSGRKRWHGQRDNLSEPFDPLRGPLAGYLAGGRVKQCSAGRWLAESADRTNNFEAGCGGYGYNMTYIGSRLWQAGLNFTDAYAQTTRSSQIANPGTTLMFADCALSTQQGYYIEYSFAEPPFAVYDGRLITDFYMSPSIHFRHGLSAGIGWADGHADRQGMGNFQDKNVYGVISAQMQLGWFEPLDNSLFDLD